MQSEQVQKQKRDHIAAIPLFFCDLGEIQTPNLLSRNQVHYSVMLRGQNSVFIMVQPLLTPVLNHTLFLPLFLQM